VLIDRVFGVKSNFSDRWLAWNSGTTTQGNSPHTVAETLRKAGVPLQSKWDITRDVNTFDKWYQTPPMGLFKEARLDFLNQYKIKHDYVNNDANSIKDALRFSPLGVSVGWNNKDSEGRWFKNGDGPDFHWVMMYGYVEGNHWKVFDSYDSSHKKLRWDAKPEMIKRFSISRANLSEEITIRMQLINALQRLIDLLRL
jgi:hypothetical protein